MVGAVKAIPARPPHVENGQGQCRRWSRHPWKFTSVLSVLLKAKNDT